MQFGCDLSIEEYAKDFEKLGYTHEESVELAKATIHLITNPDIDFTQLVQPLVQIDTEEFNRIVDAFDNVEEGYPVLAKDFERILEREEDES